MKKQLNLIVMSLLLLSSNLYSQNCDDIILPIPNMSGGKPLMVALKERESNRKFSSKEIPLQMLSDMLWATNGINRPDKDKKTAPTAMNWQDLEVYVIMPQGIYHYLAKENILKCIKTGNFMKESGKQDFVDEAALNIVFVSDLSKMGPVSKEDKYLYAGIHAGATMQNLYLYCASVGLNTVTRHWFDLKKMTEIMELKENELIVLIQTVGYKPE